METQRILISILIVFVLIGSANANSDEINDLILGKTLSNVIYEVSEDIIEGRAEIVTINVSTPTHPFVVKFISNEYATINNISCDGGDCVLFGRYQGASSTIHILPEAINGYYNESSINITLDKISNTFVHELNHHYVATNANFFPDMIDSLGSDNPNGFNDLNLTGIPIHLQSTVNFSHILPIYDSVQRMEEVVVRINAICFQEKRDYENYWDMVQVKGYPLCSQYEFPVYVDNQLADGFEAFIEAYVLDYLNISEYALLSQSGKARVDLSSVVTDGFSITGIMVNGVVSIIITLALPVTIISGLIGIAVLIFKGFHGAISDIMLSIIKKK